MALPDSRGGETDSPLLMENGKVLEEHISPEILVRLFLIQPSSIYNLYIRLYINELLIKPIFMNIIQTLRVCMCVTPDIMKVFNLAMMGNAEFNKATEQRPFRIQLPLTAILNDCFSSYSFFWPTGSQPSYFRWCLVFCTFHLHNVYNVPGGSGK